MGGTQRGEGAAGGAAGGRGASRSEHAGRWWETGPGGLQGWAHDLQSPTLPVGSAPGPLPPWHPLPTAPSPPTHPPPYGTSPPQHPHPHGTSPPRTLPPTAPLPWKKLETAGNGWRLETGSHMHSFPPGLPQGRPRAQGCQGVRGALCSQETETEEGVAQPRPLPETRGQERPGHRPGSSPARLPMPPALGGRPHLRVWWVRGGGGCRRGCRPGAQERSPGTRALAGKGADIAISVLTLPSGSAFGAHGPARHPPRQGPPGLE